MIPIYEQARKRRTVKKSKIFKIASILHIFLFFFKEPHTYLCNTFCKSHAFPVSCFESGNTFQKM